MCDQERFADAQEFLDSLQADNPELYSDPRVQACRTRVEDALSEVAAHETKFQGVMDRLQQIRQRGYLLAPIQIQAVLREAESVAATPEEQTQVQAWAQGWELWKEDRQERANQLFKERLASILQNLGRREQLAMGPPDAQRRHISLLRTQIQEARPLEDQAEDSLKGQLNELAQQVDAWATELARTAQNLAQRETQRQRMLERYPTLPPDRDAYIGLLQEFVDTYPNEPQTPSFKRVLRDVDLHADAVALRQFQLNGFPPGTAEVNRINELVKSLPNPAASVWSSDLEACSEARDRVRNALTRLNRMRDAKSYNLKMFKRRNKEFDRWETVYYPDDINSKEEERPNGDKVTLYWGRVYRTSATEAAAWLEHIKFDSTEYEVRIERRREKNIVAHSQYVRELLAEARRQDDLGVFLVGKMEELAKDQECELIPKAGIISYLAAAAAELLPEAGMELTALAETFADLAKVDASWMNHAHESVIAADLEIRARLDGFPDMKPIILKVEMLRGLRVAALSRRVICVGCVAQSADGRLSPVIRAGRPDEVWTILSGVTADRPNRFFIVANRDRNGAYEIRSDAEDHLYVGQLLFAAADGRTCDAILRGLFGDARMVVEWPESWPVNARRLPRE